MKNFIMAGITFLSIVSCRQDPAPDPQATDCKLATAYFDYNGNETFNVGYSNNKISSMNGTIRSVKYIYSNSGLPSEKEYLCYGLPDDKYIYTENNGQITEQKLYKYDGTTYVYHGKQTFTYSGGRIQKMSYFGVNGEPEEYAEYIWTGDNITEIKTYHGTGVYNCSIFYTYDLSRVNTFNNVYPDFEFQNVHRAKWLDVRFLSKNVLTQTKYCDNSIENFSNTFTSTDLMNKATGTGNGQDYYRFTYNCQ